VKDIIEDVEIIEQLEILKNKANVGNSKIPSRRIAESVDLVLANTYRTLFCGEDACDQIKKCCFAGTAWPYYGDLFTLLNRQLGDIQAESVLTIRKPNRTDSYHFSPCLNYSLSHVKSSPVGCQYVSP
jgi:hypothetical protein